MNSNKSKMSCNQGFTLVELLVVVLISGILAAVAVPQYQKTVERSKATEAMNMLSSIAKAHQTHYLANGTFATKFEQLDVDIPFTGNTKFVSTGDTKSNKDWSFQIEVVSSGKCIYAARIDGKYKGAGFLVTLPKRKPIRCFERKSGANIHFDQNLPDGAYCEQVMQASYDNEDKWQRWYNLP